MSKRTYSCSKGGTLHRASIVDCHFICILIGLTFSFIAPLPAMARPPRYRLHKWSSGERTVVQVYELKTGRTIWTHSYYGNQGHYSYIFPCWSRDHRALAFSVNREPGESNYPGNFEGYHIIVWRAGQRVHTIAHQSVTREDYVEDMIWSPDDNYLLVRSGGSGMGDENIGEITCVDVTTWKTWSVGSGKGPPSWVKADLVKYWPFHLVSGFGVVRGPHPIYWHLPRK
jgi:hypothetical protein